MLNFQGVNRLRYCSKSMKFWRNQLWYGFHAIWSSHSTKSQEILVSKHWSFCFLLSHYIPIAFEDIPQAQGDHLPSGNLEISKCQWRRWRFDQWSRILPWDQYQKVVVIKHLHETWPSAYRNAKASYLPASLVHQTWWFHFHRENVYREIWWLGTHQVEFIYI